MQKAKKQNKKQKQKSRKPHNKRPRQLTPDERQYLETIIADYEKGATANETSRSHQPA